MKKFLALFLAIVTIFSLAGCSSMNPIEAEEAVFSSDGLEITLTEAFKEASFEGYTVCYDSLTVAVFALKEEFSTLGDFASDMTVEEYAEMVCMANAASNMVQTTIDGVTCAEYSYDDEEAGSTYKYLATMFKGPDAFWLIQFSCDSSNYDEYRPYFIKWAKSAKFTEA